MLNRRFWLNDRRRYERLKADLSVWFKIHAPYSLRAVFGEKEFEATTVNISQGGMALLTKCNIPIWSVLQLKFVLIKTDDEGIVGYSSPVYAVGEVRSNIFTEDHEFRLGICFKAITSDYKHEITNLASVRF